jgi:acetylglutamate kinase
VAYFLRCVELLQRSGVEPVCVFDGGKLPSKAAEEAERERCVVLFALLLRVCGAAWRAALAALT